MEDNYLESVTKEFRYYKMLAEKAMEQLNDEQLFTRHTDRSNSIGIIVRHLSGNMLSRFTNFLTEDGEKQWRDRDGEFRAATQSREELMNEWQQGWGCVFYAVDNLQSDDLEKIIYIRNQGHTVIEAINRQLAHYSYHIGQIVFIAKMLADKWNSLSIPLNESEQFNADKFAKEKMRAHFSDGILNKDPETEL